MVCSFLILPHVNTHYREAQVRLAQAELLCMSSRIGLTSRPVVVTMGGATFLELEVPDEKAGRLNYLSHHSDVLMIFRREGEALYPVETPSVHYLPEELPEVLKYKGKTATTFTRKMMNMALALSKTGPDQIPLVLDPLCGKGTTLFCACQRGMNAAGVEIDRKNLKEAMDYLNRFFQFHHLKYTLTQGAETVGKHSVPSALYTTADTKEHFSAGNVRSLRLYLADTGDTGFLMRKTPADLLVADLPYGIQHAPQAGQKPEGFIPMLERVLPEWKAALRPGGVMALSFNTMTLKTEKLRQMALAAGFQVYTGDYFETMEHEVEQAIRRDVLFAARLG